MGAANLEAGLAVILKSGEVLAAEPPAHGPGGLSSRFNARSRIRGTFGLTLGRHKCLISLRRGAKLGLASA